MKVTRISFLLLAMAVAVVSLSPLSPRLFRGQSGKTAGAACCGSQHPVAPRELGFPYYSLRDGFNSTLYLVSDLPFSIPLTIAVRNLVGQAVFSTPTIEPSQRLTLDLRALLTAQGADANGAFAEGSVAVYFTGTIMPVVGQITISNPLTHLVHESEMQENDPGRTDVPAVQNGLWWGLSGGRDARIMVSNTKGQIVVADVFLDFLGKPHQVSQNGIAFNPHETKVLSVTEMLGQIGFSSAQAPQGGITIIARGAVGGLMAQGKILDPITGFSTTRRFPSPDTQIKNALHAEGIPIGKPTKDSPFLGMGVFTPHVALRNLTDLDQTVTFTIEYPQGPLVEKAHKVEVNGKETDKYREFDGESGENTGQLPLPPLTLAAHSTQEFSLASALGQLPLPIPYASVRIQFTGPPNAIIGELASVDEASDLVVDSRVVKEGWPWMGSGANPWHLDDQTEAILFLTDMGDQPVSMGFFVSVGQTRQYLTQLQLQPHETRAINLPKLRDTQRADFKQRKIPADATDGTVTCVRIGNQPVAGRVVVVNRRTGTASNYDCCCCPCPLWYYDGEMYVSPSEQALAVNGVADFYALADFYDCNNNGPYTFNSGANWMTQDSNVATVDAGGKVTGVGAGSTSIIADYTGCTDWEMENYSCTCLNESESQSPGTADVGDGMPVISSTSPSSWVSGQSYSNGTIIGQYFGTNPTVQLSDNSITFSYTPVNDGQINFSTSIPATTQTETVTLTVTSRGYGNGFAPIPGQNNSPSNNKNASNTAPIPTNFTQSGSTANSNGNLSFTYTWGSNTGSLSDLSACGVYETVTYPGPVGTPQNPVTYNWPLPWQASSNNPDVGPVPNIPGSDGRGGDTQFTRNINLPYQTQNFNATQVYS